MSDRLTPYGVIDKYFYSGDDGKPVLGWSSFHAQNILDLLTAEGYQITNIGGYRGEHYQTGSTGVPYHVDPNRTMWPRCACGEIVPDIDAHIKENS